MRVRGIIFLVKSNQLVKNMETKHFQLAKRDSAAIVLVFKAGAFRYQRAITYSLVDSSTNQNAALLIDNQLDFTNILQPLSPAKASLCCGEAGDKEKESAFFFFPIIAIFIQREPLWRERVLQLKLKLVALTSLEMTGIPVTFELKNEAIKAYFDTNKKKLKEWQPFDLVCGLRISKKSFSVANNISHSMKLYV